MPELNPNDTNQLKTEISHLQTEIERLNRFIDIGKRILGEKDLDRLLPLVMTEISKLLQADRSTLFLIDWERMELWTKFAEGLDDKKKIVIKLKMGLVGVCVLTKNVVNVADTYKDLRFNPEIDEITGFRTDCVLCAPLFDKQKEVMGAVELINKKTGCFTKDDEQCCVSLTSMITSLEEPERAMALIDTLIEATRCERGSIFLIDREKGHLFSIVAKGIKDQGIRLGLNLGIAGLVAVTGQDLLIPDTYHDKRFDRSTDEATGFTTRCILCVPLKNMAGEIIGVIELMNKINGVFTESDMEDLRGLSSHVAIAIEDAVLFQEQQRQFRSVLEVLAASIDAKDPLTAGHSQKVNEYSVAIARELGFGDEELDVLGVAALLHDYGKLGTNDRILKKPGRLTPEEYKHIQKHVLDTLDIIKKMYFMPKYRNVPIIAASHHERLDGSGYPNNLNAHEIPFMSKIIAVADVFEALTAKRHYREAMSIKDAIRFLENSSTHLDVIIIEALKRYLEKKQSA